MALIPSISCRKIANPSFNRWHRPSADRFKASVYLASDMELAIVVVIFAGCKFYHDHNSSKTEPILTTIFH